MDLASSSSSSSSLTYDGFLSFRGEDTRQSFVCHLHKALELKALKVYIDKEDLKKGDRLSALLEAIAESKLSIVVFSENYGNSTWCLKELVKILECNKAKQKQIVIPVFYKVDPSHIRKQTESFGEAFAKHERDREKDKELLQEVQTWRSALREAADLAGWDSKNYEDDAKLIERIVNDVLDKVNRISPHIEDGLVAMDSHLRQVERLLNDAPDDVVCVGIWGMGGLGKTTIARAVYDRICQKFDHRCFLQNVRERFTRNEEVQMKVEFLSAILNEKVGNFGGGYTQMLTRLGDKKILVVLDDVLNSTQINTLLGQKRSFGGGSIIIVTTRDEHVVRRFEKYKPEPLSDEDALKLFSQNAFNTDKPSGEYEHLSRCMVEYARGLPLALLVLGASLHDRSVSNWEDQLKKLKNNPNPDIEKALKISYDGLDQGQQDIFLDIACFFKGMDKDYVADVLVNCGFLTLDLDVLVERALVTISYFKTLEMHDLLQEMGRKIEKGGKRSRFWGEEAERVLTENTATEYAEHLMIDLPNKVLFRPSMRIFTYGQRYAGDDGQNHLTGEFNFLSRELKVLVWHGCPQKCLPSNFDPKNLVLLDVRHSNFEQLWEGTKPAEKLISIDLSGSQYLKRIPDLTLATNLEKLNFRVCSSLTKVHPSISALTNLVFLDLSDCGKLRSLPSSIGHLKSLKTLNLSCCSNLEMLPEISEDMEALSELDLSYSGIKELPWSIERLRGLKSLNMCSCKSLDYLPDSICNLAKLRSLCLAGCTELRKLPRNIGNLESLLELKVNGSGIEQLPVSILRLKHGRLSFSKCGRMAAPLSSWPSSIEDHCTAVLHLDFSDCNLMELSDALAHFSSLKVLRLSGNKNLESLPAIMKRLDFLVELKLNGCKRLRSIPELSPTIRYINASDCTALESVSTPESPYDVGRCFIFSNCSQLVQKDVFRDIVETHLSPQGNCSRPFYVAFPGSEIPEWFTHQCKGPSVTVKLLPPNCFDKKFLGFTICAVTNKPQGVDDFILTARCFCTFKGDHCEYRFSFYLFDVHSDDRSKWFESNHMLVGYVPWSESGMIKREEVNERRYTDAKFEIQLQYYKSNNNRLDPCIERCGVRFVFANSEEDFGEPMAEVDNSERSFEGCSDEPSGTDITNEDEQYLKLSQVFKGANRAPSYIKIEDNDLSGKRKTLERWTQKVRVTSGLLRGSVDDGFKWLPGLFWDSGGDAYYCGERVQPRCWAKAIKPTHDDPTIFQITYVERHTCWKFQPMLTHQVRAKPGMGIEGPFDGFTWGEYTQTNISGAEYPRVYYYVCTPQNVKGCMAIKEVQHSSDKKILKITYRGTHTCIEASDSIAGEFEIVESEGSVESSFHEQVVLSPSSLGANSQDMLNRKEVTEKDKDNGVLDSSDGEKSVKVKRHKGKEEAGSRFGYGSKVIVTTRDEQVLGGFSRIYKPKPLSDPDALELFNQNAFRTMPPSEEYGDLSRRAIKYAHGLPLALKIWGAYLRDRSPSVWKDELEMLKEIPDLDVHHVHHVLKRSFDGLDEYQKNIFLDIACFFKGMHNEYVEIILNSCGFFASGGLSVLIERDLVSISKCGGLEIHDFLQEIGRDIIRKEPWKHSRLWSYEDVQDTITQNKAMEVEGVMIELSGSEDICVDPEAFVSMMNLRLLRITYPPYVNKFDVNKFDENFKKNFEGELWPERRYDDSKYSRCKLRLNGYNLKFLSHKLRVLAWHGCPVKSLPSKFNPTYLVDLDMSHSHIEQLWPEPKAAKELISINLTSCKNLKEIPLCTVAPKLQKLILKDCTSLVEVSPSISALTGLVFLSLGGCTELKSLPSNIHMMKSLKTLVLSGCSNLEMFPEISEDMEALSELKLGGTGIKELPSSIERLRGLKSLDLSCTAIKELPSSIVRLRGLKSLDLSRTVIKELPSSIVRLRGLKSLDLSDCSNLEMFPEISEDMEALSELKLGRTAIKELPSSIVRLRGLKSLDLSYWSNLEMFPEISEDMEALSELMLEGSAIKELPSSIERLRGLKSLDLSRTAIKELPSSIERLRGLHSLSMNNCKSLVCLPDSICNMADLTYLYLRESSKLCNLPENLGNLKSLFELDVRKTGLKRLPASILHLKIGRLEFDGCEQMEAPLSSWPSSIEDRCTVVVHLAFCGCDLKELSDAIAYFRSLKVLNLSRNKNLTSLPAAMNQLGCLERLELEDCKKLRSIPELPSRISYINAHNCTALEAVSTPQSPYDIGRCFQFSNCHQLVQKDFFRDIVETHSPPQGNCSRPFYFCIPGSEIPEQFIHQCRGSSVTAQLPQNWFDNKFLGFAICAVTDTPRSFHYHRLTARCICTFKGEHCEYRFSFYLFDSHFDYFYRNVLVSDHMLVGYVPWSEFGINEEEVNERCYTEANFEIELLYDGESHEEFHERRVILFVKDHGKFAKLEFDRLRSIERCGVRFFFANNEEEEVAHQDFGEPIVHNSEIRSLEGCSADHSGSDITSDTSDEEEQYLKLSEVFEGDNREPSYIRNEDNDSSRKRKTLESWTQEVRVTSGLMQGELDDGLESWTDEFRMTWRLMPRVWDNFFKWNWPVAQANPAKGTMDLRYACRHLPGCWARAKVRSSIDDRTILEITYAGRHTCWKTLPMLTHQVRVTPGMETEGPSDGFRWVKYAQTDILGAKSPRVYYVCAPQNVGGCMAIKEVQRSNDKEILKITYRGRHTCTLASTSNGGRVDSSTSVANGASSVHDQVVQSPSSPGANDHGGNEIRVANNPVDEDNMIVLRDASPQDMDVNDMEYKDMANCLCPLWWCWRLWTSITSGKGLEK